MARSEGRYRKFHGRRALLNQPGQQTTAAIVAEIEDSSTWHGVANKYDEPRCTLQLSNCDRSISFECSISGLMYENDLEKVSIMIDALQKFRRGMVKEHSRHLARVEAYGWDKDDED